MAKKTLIVSLHIGGGCFQYGNELFSRVTFPHDIYIPNDVTEPLKISGYKQLTYWKKSKLLRTLSLLYFLVRIVVLGNIGYYDKLILAGYTTWDYYIMKAWQLTRRPSYFVVHDGVMHTGENKTKTQNRLISTMRMATNLIFLSAFVRDNLKQRYEIDKPYIIVPHGLIDYGDIEPSSQVKVPNLLFVGRIGEYKGVDILLEAIKNVDKSLFNRLVIAGQWISTVPKDIPEKVEIINQWLTNDQIRDFISQSDVMIFPYREASQSGVATLAVRYEKPSIVSNVGALAEQFPCGSAIIINDISADKLSLAIENICSDLSLRNKMQQAIRQGKNRYEWDKIAEQFNLQMTDKR